MRFLIRDDDTCFFTRAEELESCYGHIYQEIPVCLSLTPFRVAGKYYAEANDPNREMPIDENPELVAYLKEGIEVKRYDLALHGYSHIYYNDINREERIPEYKGQGDLHKRTAKAKDYLEQLFGYRINTFVPPSNEISKKGIEAIISNGLNLMHVPGFRSEKRPFSWRNLHNFLKTRWWVKYHQHPIYPFPIDFGNHQEMASHLLYPKSDLPSLLDQLQRVYQLRGTFVLATHYHSFNKRIKSGETIGDALNKIIEKVRNMKGTKFITYRDLWIK